MERKFKNTVETLGDLSAITACEIFDGELLDTVIKIGGENLCWITYGDKDKFFKELNDVISKYRI